MTLQKRTAVDSPETSLRPQTSGSRPGARTLSAARYAGVAPAVQLRAAPRADAEAAPDAWLAGPDPFDYDRMATTGFVQARGGAVAGQDPLGTAAAGVATASDPLPFAQRIQQSFGRHDIGSIRTATGGDAQQASEALGASAYAAGDRVAFARAPDLHTAAHEAAHVVQQRSGVSLAGGVGASGDRYEQHADRVADLVVRGESAEDALSDLAGGGSSRAVQRHDSPHHVAIGDSVSGESVSILGVEFSPGECAAFVDYVGQLVPFRIKCEAEAAAETAATKGETVRRLIAMREMLRTGNEDTLMWDQLTHGSYSELTESNEDHFSQDEDGETPNHSDSFVSAVSAALVFGAGGQVEDGRMHLYTAEHYLQDAFSSGHLVAQPDIDAAVDQLLTGNAEVAAMMPIIASSVYDLGRDVIDCYAIVVPGVGQIAMTREIFITTVFMATMMKNGENALVKSSLRKFVHEQLDAGVEVTSPAHPEPWIMKGDHMLDMENQEQTVLALQQAIAEVRDLFDANTVKPVADPAGEAQSLLDHHKPVPTGAGEETIDAAIEQGTASRLLFMNAMVEAGVSTLAGALDVAVGMSHGAIVRNSNPNELHDEPIDLPQLDRGEPANQEPGAKLGDYVDWSGRSETQVQRQDAVVQLAPESESSEASSSEEPAADPAAATEALQIAAVYLIMYGKDPKREPAPAPWTDAVNDIAAATTNLSESPAARLTLLERGLTGLDSARAASPGAAVNVDREADVVRAQINVDDALERQQRAAEIHGLCEQLEELDMKTSVMAAAGAASGLVKPGLEDWTPVNLSIPGPDGPTPISIPARDGLGVAMTTLRAAADAWMLVDKLENRAPTGDLNTEAGIIFGAAAKIGGSLINVSAGFLRQAAAVSTNKETAAALAEASTGLGTAGKAVSGVIGGFAALFTLNASVLELVDASTPAIERADAAVGVVTGMAGLTSSLVGIAELATAGALSAEVATVGAAAGAVSFVVGPAWFIVKTWLTEFPKLKAIGQSLIIPAVEDAIALGSDVAQRANRVATTLQMADQDLAMREAAQASTSELCIAGRDLEARAGGWRFESFAEAVCAAYASSGLATAGTPDEALAAAGVFLDRLTVILDEVPAMLQRELGLADEELPTGLGGSAEE